MRKIRILLICVLCMAFTNIGHASEDMQQRYIVKPKENAGVKLFSIKSNDMLPLGDGLYLTNNVSDLKNAEYYFRDHELQMLEADYPAVTSDEQFSNQWYLDSIKSEAAREKGITGNGVKIAVADSGLNINHQDLNPYNILPGCNCITGALDSQDISDNVGHGTMVAGVICAQIDNQLNNAGISDGVTIIPIKVSDGNSLYLSSMILGMKKAIECGCDIINISFGGTLKNSDGTLDELALNEINKIMTDAESRGIIVVAAAGNSGGTSGENEIYYPAGCENVIGVGSVGKQKEVSWFSQRNASVFVTAPGEDIVSLSNTENDGIAIKSGTSFSAPMVSAAAALVKEIVPDITPAQFRELLKNTSVDDEIYAGYDIQYGYGVIDISAMLNELSEYIPKFSITQGIKNSKKRIHIHNNTGMGLYARYLFASYANETLNEFNLIQNQYLSTGVTNAFPVKEYDALFLWDEKMSPFISKYYIR